MSRAIPYRIRFVKTKFNLLHLSHPVTLAREIFSSNLGARHVYTVFDRVHLCPTHVNCMYELVNQSLQYLPKGRRARQKNMCGVSQLA